MTTPPNADTPGASAQAETTPSEPVVYKICSRAAWQEALRSGELFPSPDDIRDGFIHLSSRSQVRGTLSRHFAGESDLMLLSVATARLASGALCWEKSRSGQAFPHLYGALPCAAVVEAIPLAESSGQPALPEGF
jgi:uncharacterized protein (DUF952 family)